VYFIVFFNPRFYIQPDDGYTYTVEHVAVFTCKIKFRIYCDPVYFGYIRI